MNFTKNKNKQANVASTVSGTGKDYQPKCGDALRLGAKGRYGSFHLWINVWLAGKLCDPSLTRAIPERLEMSSFVSYLC